MREAELVQGAVNRVVRHREPKLLMQAHDQVAGPPAYDAMDSRRRAFVDDAGEKGLVLGVELGRRARRRNVDQPLRPLLVERITQSLSV